MKELELFFEKQINEHQLIVERSKSLLMDSFLATVKICIDSLKDNKKLLFFWKWRECFRCTTPRN